MFCAKCGKELPEGANICPNCGEKVEKEVSFEDVKAYAGQKAQQASVVIRDKAQQASVGIQNKYQELKENRARAAAEAKAAAEIRAAEAKAAAEARAAESRERGDSAYRNDQQWAQGVPPVYRDTYVNIPAEYRPISMWGYFGYGILFAIPIIGLIFLLVFSFGGTQNINLKNYARSHFCLLIVILIILILIWIIAAFAAASR